MQFLRKKNHPFEENITEDYLKVINEAYNQFFINYDISPLLVINTNEIDFVMNPEKIDDVINYINNPFQGTKYFNPKD